jgi:histidyl-tRNA synthetase
VTKIIQSVRGMNDILPQTSTHWRQLEQVLAAICDAYGYQEIRPPLLERTELFKRSIGEQTDIVEKEMYTFVDNNGESVTLRPEATASCVRAGIEHGLLHNKQAKFWYLGPMFRHEKPQKGRYRQFHQFGIEALGWPGPDADAELQMFAARLFSGLGVKSVKLQINTLGSNACRTAYRDALHEYLSAHREKLDEDSRRRLDRNTLRILDSKDPATRGILEDAPRLSTFLDQDSVGHFNRLRAYLDTVGIEYTVNDQLVRGLDYYTSTVFEWVTDRLGAQSAVCAGGRYDGLVEQLGGRPAPATGFALGIERLLELVALEGRQVAATYCDVFVATMGDGPELAGARVAESLRSNGLRALVNFGGGNLKKQLRRADTSGARFAVIIGDDELSADSASVKDLRGETEQAMVPVTSLPRYLSSILAASAVATAS